MNIQQGDILNSRKRIGKRKVLAISSTDLIALSLSDNFDSFGYWISYKDAKRDYDLPEVKWVPAECEVYYFIDTLLEVVQTANKNSIGRIIIETGNFFQTKEEAQLYADKFKQLLTNRE